MRMSNVHTACLVIELLLPTYLGYKQLTITSLPTISRNIDNKIGVYCLDLMTPQILTMHCEITVCDPRSKPKDSVAIKYLIIYVNIVRIGLELLFYRLCESFPP